MRPIPFALLAVLCAMPVGAQPYPPQPGEVLANRLPDPPVDEDAPPRAFLLAARLAVTGGRMGEAQEALERAESRALTRDVRPSLAGQPSTQALVLLIKSARGALASGDSDRCLETIDAALRDPDSGR